MSEHKIRADLFLVKNKIAPSREKAKFMLENGFVLIDGRAVKPSSAISLDAKIAVLNQAPVSRAYYKLKHALDVWGEKFNLNQRIEANIVLDVGSSTGGFVQVLLEIGAGRVYAVDVGEDQLHSNFVSNPKVVVCENTDIRDFKTKDEISFFSVDVSFISLKLVLPHLASMLKSGVYGVVLFKPQFEVGKNKLGKNARVSKENALCALNGFKNEVKQTGFKFIDCIKSPILGKKSQNMEFLVLLERV